MRQRNLEAAVFFFQPAWHTSADLDWTAHSHFPQQTSALHSLPPLCQIPNWTGWVQEDKYTSAVWTILLHYFFSQFFSPFFLLITYVASYFVIITIFFYKHTWETGLEMMGRKGSHCKDFLRSSLVLQTKYLKSLKQDKFIWKTTLHKIRTLRNVHGLHHD